MNVLIEIFHLLQNYPDWILRWDFMRLKLPKISISICDTLLQSLTEEIITQGDEDLRVVSQTKGQFVHKKSLGWRLKSIFLFGWKGLNQTSLSGSCELRLNIIRDPN